MVAKVQLFFVTAKRDKGFMIYNINGGSKPTVWSLRTLRVWNF